MPFYQHSKGDGRKTHDKPESKSQKKRNPRGLIYARCATPSDPKCSIEIVVAEPDDGVITLYNVDDEAALALTAELLRFIMLRSQAKTMAPKGKKK